jgi:hypothetical protein
MVNARKIAYLGHVFLFALWGCCLCWSTVGYVPINRKGKTSQQLAGELRERLLKVANPVNVGPILAAEVGNNDKKCKRTVQVTYLAEHLREHGHWEETYAVRDHRGLRAPDSKYRTVSGLNVTSFDRIIKKLVGLLLSGRVSFSVGRIQGPFNPPPPELSRNEYGFILYANIDGHGIVHLDSPAGHHKAGGNTNYVRIVFRFMDRVRMELGSLGLPDQQLIMVTMFSESPVSKDLASSILPNGVDAAGRPAGVAIGAAPVPPAADHRIPAVL